MATPTPNTTASLTDINKIDKFKEISNTSTEIKNALLKLLALTESADDINDGIISIFGINENEIPVGGSVDNPLQNVLNFPITYIPTTRTYETLANLSVNELSISRSTLRIGQGGYIRGLGALLQGESFATGRTFVMPFQYYSKDSGSEKVRSLSFSGSSVDTLQSDDATSMNATGSFVITATPETPLNQIIYELKIKCPPNTGLTNFRFKAKVVGQSESFFYFPSKGEYDAGVGANLSGSLTGEYTIDVSDAPIFLLNRPNIEIDHAADTGNLLGNGTIPYLRLDRASVELKELVERDEVDLTPEVFDICLLDANNNEIKNVETIDELSGQHSVRLTASNIQNLTNFAVRAVRGTVTESLSSTDFNTITNGLNTKTIEFTDTDITNLRAQPNKGLILDVVGIDSQNNSISLGTACITIKSSLVGSVVTGTLNITSKRNYDTLTNKSTYLPYEAINNKLISLSANTSITFDSSDIPIEFIAIVAGDSVNLSALSGVSVVGREIPVNGDLLKITSINGTAFNIYKIGNIRDTNRFKKLEISNASELEKLSTVDALTDYMILGIRFRGDFFGLTNLVLEARVGNTNIPIRLGNSGNYTNSITLSSITDGEYLSVKMDINHDTNGLGNSLTVDLKLNNIIILSESIGSFN